jgi:two-component system chemotaxis sensor kinase CheA
VTVAAQRILVVEDDPNLRHLLETALIGADFDVRSAEHGGEALRMLRDGDFAGVVLDLVLPWVNGIEVLSSMRADRRLASLPVLVITGTPMMEHELRAFRPLRLLHKPFAIVAAIATMLAILSSPDALV